MIRKNRKPSAGIRPVPVRRPQAGLPRTAWWGWGLVGCLVVAALVYATWEILPVLFASAVVAYLLDRPIRWLHSRGISRDGAFTILVALATALIVVTVLLIVPSIANQIGELSVRLKPALITLQAQAGPLADRLYAETGVQVPVDIAGLADIAPSYLKQLWDAPDARDAAKSWIGTVFGTGMALAGSILQLTLLPLFSFYLASDWPRIVAGVDDMVPARHRPLVHEVVIEIHTRIGGFIEGQVALCGILGVLYSAGLLIVGVDLAITIGMLSGALFVVPYLGTVVGIVLSSVLALLEFGLDWHVFGCLITFAVVQGLEGSLLTPRIVGERVGLHPLVVMVAVVAGGYLLGIWGVLLAVPLTAALSVIAGALVRAYKQSRLYTT